MPRRRLLGHHHRDDEADERDWRERRGIYAGLAPDGDDGDVQVRPGWWREGRPPPAAGDLTHHFGDDGIRLREADDGD